MLYSIETFLVQSWYSYRALFRDAELKSYIILKIFQPIFQLLFFVLLIKYCLQTGDLTVRIIGNSFLLCQKNCIHGLAKNFATERQSGTLKWNIAAPRGMYVIFFEKSFVHLWDSLVSVYIGMFTGWILFGMDLGGMKMPILFLTTFLAVFSCAGMGMILNSLGVMSDNLLLYNNFVVMLLTTFSGAMFPLEWLPSWLRGVSFFVPTSRCIRAVGEMIAGAGLRQVLPLLVGELVLGGTYMLIGYFMIWFAGKMAVKKGTMYLY